MSEPSAGFVIKAIPKSAVGQPQWLSLPSDDSAFEFFGPRERAWVFPTQDAAAVEAQRWRTLLEPALSIVVEPG